MSESNEEMKGNETKQDEPKREKVRVVDISLIKDFPGHPFLVKDDESMVQLVKSIEMNGVLNPVIARKIGEDQYELISGHRRKHACILLGIKNKNQLNSRVHNDKFLKNCFSGTNIFFIYVDLANEPVSNGIYITSMVTCFL